MKRTGVDDLRAELEGRLRFEILLADLSAQFVESKEHRLGRRDHLVDGPGPQPAGPRFNGTIGMTKITSPKK